MYDKELCLSDIIILINEMSIYNGCRVWWVGVRFGNACVMCV